MVVHQLDCKMCDKCQIRGTTHSFDGTFRDHGPNGETWDVDCWHVTCQQCGRNWVLYEYSNYAGVDKIECDR